jgi:hypothetical protein
MCHGTVSIMIVTRNADVQITGVLTLSELDDQSSGAQKKNTINTQTICRNVKHAIEFVVGVGKARTKWLRGYPSSLASGKEDKPCYKITPLERLIKF